MFRPTGPVAGRVINVCFHGIGTPQRILEPNEELYWVGVEQFDELLDVIQRHPAVRITFDDGNGSDAAVGLPALARRGLSATFFVLAGRLDERGSLSSSDVAELAARGMTIGSHGMFHRPWRGLDDAGLDEELVEAPKLLASVARRSIDDAACPFGAYDRRVLRAVREAGFRHVYTVDGGPARTDAWLQSRYVIRADDTPQKLEQVAQATDVGFVPAALRPIKAMIKRWR